MAHSAAVSRDVAGPPVLVYNVRENGNVAAYIGQGGRMCSAARNETLSRRIDFLKSVPLFAGLRDQDLAALVHDLRLREYGRGETIFHQGDHGRELYIVVRGKVRIFKTSPSGNETSINIFAGCDVIGEFSVLDDLPRSATAKAIGPCVVLAMTQERFLQHMREIPDLAIAVARLLASKVRWTAAYAETIAQFDAAGRLLHILLFYNEQFGREVEAGKRYVLDLSLNQTDLASLVGARREWVNRILQDWRRRGLLEYEGGKITLLDLPAVVRERDSRIEANLTDAAW